MADRFSSDKRRAQNSSNEKLDIIMANLNYLEEVGRNDLIKMARDFNRLRGQLTPNQLSALDGILAQIYKAAGYGSEPTRHDNKKTIRY